MSMFQKKIIINKFKAVRIVGFCAIAAMVVGFAKPELSDSQNAGNQGTVGLSLEEWVARPMNRSVPTNGARAIDGTPIRPKIHFVSPELTLRASRPSSYASASTMNAILDRVNSRHWLKPAKYSPDMARAELLGNRPVTFHGVGFPDIRTDRKPKHYFNAVTADPTQWNQLVTWRKTQSHSSGSEPIAHVRCMGLSPQQVAR